MFKQKRKTKFYDVAEHNGNGQAIRIDKFWKRLNKISVILTIVLSIGFIVTVNSLAIKGFILQSLKNKVERLRQENANVKLKIMALESYENINRKATNLKMVKAEKIEYLTVSDNLMAKK